MTNQVVIDGRAIRPPFSGVAQYTGRLFFHLKNGDLNYELVAPPGKNVLEFYNMLGVNPTGIKRTTFIPSKLLTFSIRYLPRGGFANNYFKNADIVHLTYFETFPRNCKEKTKKVLTVHDMIYLRHPAWFNKRNLHASLLSSRQLLTNEVSYVITPSIKVADEVKNFGYKGPIKVIPLAPTITENLNGFIPEPINKLIKEKPFALYLGNLENRKGITNLLTAWINSKTCHNYRLIIIGKDLYPAQKLEGYITGLIAAGHDIVRLPFVSETIKKYALETASFFIYPSLDEGFGFPVLDAMSVGTPVIASRIDSIQEFAANTILYFDPKNIEELSAQIDALGFNSSLRKEISAGALIKAKEYTWERTARETQAVYLELLK